METEASKGLLL